jgi:hypothetical protein
MFRLVGFNPAPPPQVIINRLYRLTTCLQPPLAPSPQ